MLSGGFSRSVGLMAMPPQVSVAPYPWNMFSLNRSLQRFATSTGSTSPAEKQYASDERSYSSTRSCSSSHAVQGRHADETGGFESLDRVKYCVQVHSGLKDESPTTYHNGGK